MRGIQLPYAANAVTVNPECTGFGTLYLKRQRHLLHVLRQVKVTLVADDARIGEQPGELCGDICRMLATAQPVLIRGAGKRTGSEG